MRNYPPQAPTRGDGTSTTTNAHSNRQLNSTGHRHQHHPTQTNQSHGHEIPLVTLQNQSKTVPCVLASRFNKPSRLCHKTSCPHPSSHHPFPVSHCPNQIGATTTETTGHALPQQGSYAVSTDSTPSGKRRITQICSPTGALIWYHCKGVLYRAKQQYPGRYLYMSSEYPMGHFCG